MDMNIYRDMTAINPQDAVCCEESYDKRGFMLGIIDTIAKSELTDKQYKVYKMYYKNNMKMCEIAEHENVSAPAVSKIIKRIKITLGRYAKYVNIKP